MIVKVIIKKIMKKKLHKLGVNNYLEKLLILLWIELKKLQITVKIDKKEQTLSF